MQGNAAEELHIVMYHFPFQIVSSGRPMVMIDGFIAIDGNKIFLRIGSQFAVEIGCGNNSFFVFGKSAGCIFHDTECHGHNIIKGFLVYIERFFLEFVYLIEDTLAFIDGCIFDILFQFCNLLLLFFSCILHISLYFFGFCTQFIVAKCLYLRIDGIYTFD